jgi:hypothetical protein
MTNRTTLVVGRIMAMVALAAIAVVWLPSSADAQNVVRARIFRGGSNAGAPGGWAPAPASIDTRIWPPACGVKQSDSTPATLCTKPYFGSQPNNPVYQSTGMTGANLTFDANGFDIQFTATILGNPGFPVLILNNNEDYGAAEFGPGLGAGQDGNITFMATGVDPLTLGTAVFSYDPIGLTDPTGSQQFRYPPNSPATTPRPIVNPPNHGGTIRYVTGPERYGGTLGLTGANDAFLVLTFFPGVATTGIFPVLLGPGTPIPTRTAISDFTVPGATLVNRNKSYEVSKIFTSMGITPGGFVDLGELQGSTGGFGIREEGPYTTGAITVTQMSRPGVFPTTTTRMDSGSKNTVGGVGTIQLVKPFMIRSMGGTNGPNGRSFSTKVVLDVRVPEPGSLAMLSTGILGIAFLAAGRRRQVRAAGE